MKIDGRTLSHETSEQIRRMAVQRVLNGELPSAVIRSYGLCRTTIYKWLRAVSASGEQALRSTKGSGRPRTLTDAQRKQVRRWICGKDPRQHGFDFGLWTRRIVQYLVRERFGVSLGITSIGRLLAELDITPQKPLRRAYERDPQAVNAWVRSEYPNLKERARKCGADIFFLDEAGVRSDDPPGRTWAAKGQTPVVSTSGQRQAVNAISAVNAMGAFWYAVYTGRFNQGLFIRFLKDFLKGRRRPVFLVVDGHPAHKAKAVAAFVKSLNGRLELHFLPPYAPDLNPDEFVWNHIKRHGLSKTPLKKGESLRQRVQRDLARLKAMPSLIRAFFKAPSVAYILD